jgi:hypothetical protein
VPGPFRELSGAKASGGQVIPLRVRGRARSSTLTWFNGLVAVRFWPSSRGSPWPPKPSGSCEASNANGSKGRRCELELRTGTAVRDVVAKRTVAAVDQLTPDGQLPTEEAARLI